MRLPKVNVVVRPAQPGDAEAWARMRHALWPDQPLAELAAEVDQYLAAGLARLPMVLIAEVNGTPVGFAELNIRSYAEGCVTDRIAFLEGWYVVPDARQQGVGAALIRGAEAWGRAQGCTEFASDANIDNELSATAHLALGFEETAQLRCFRKALLIVGTLVAGFNARAEAQQPGIAGFDLEPVRRMAHRDMRGTLDSAAAGDSVALIRFLDVIRSAERATLDEPVLASVTWRLLTIWRDSSFAANTTAAGDSVRIRIAYLLDRGAGAQYAVAYPKAWGLAATHDRSLLPDTRERQRASEPPDPARDYGAADIDRMPGIVPGSCDARDFPNRFLRNGVTGRVVVQLVIDTAGHIAGDRVTLVAATHEELVSNAMRVFRSCDYAPGRLAGRAVRTLLRLPLDYVPDYVSVRRRGDMLFVPSLQLHLLGAARGLDIVGDITRAVDGDTAALRRMLEVPARVSLGSSLEMTWSAVVEALVQRFGDSALAAALHALPPPARAAVAEAWSPTEPGWSTRHPTVAAAMPQPPLRPAVNEENLAEGSLRFDADDESPPETIRGTCGVPAYPEGLRREGVQGTVMLSFIIGTDGTIEPPSMTVVSLTHPSFVGPAVAAARQCRFNAGRIGGRAVRVRVSQPVNFAFR